MRTKAAQRILDKTEKETELFVRRHTDIIVRINTIMKEKEMIQKDLAELLDKKPSEINKWLNGDHNFTLKTLAKLEAVLGEAIISIPK